MAKSRRHILNVIQTVGHLGNAEPLKNRLLISIWLRGVRHGLPGTFIIILLILAVLVKDPDLGKVLFNGTIILCVVLWVLLKLAEWLMRPTGEEILYVYKAARVREEVDREMEPTPKPLGRPHIMNMAIVVLAASLLVASIYVASAPRAASTEADPVVIAPHREKPAGTWKAQWAHKFSTRGLTVRRVLEEGSRLTVECWRYIDFDGPDFFWIRLVMGMAIVLPFLFITLPFLVMGVYHAFVLPGKCRSDGGAAPRRKVPLWCIAAPPFVLLLNEVGVVHLPAFVFVYLVWVCVFSVMLFLAYAVDKAAAVHNEVIRDANEQRPMYGEEEYEMLIFGSVRYEGQKRRTPVARLHNLAALGGWPGALVAQKLFRHKIGLGSRYYVKGFRLRVVVHCLVVASVAWYVVYLTNSQ